MLALLILIGFVGVIRALEVYLFIKKVSKLCNKHDWSCVEEDNELMVDMMENDQYYVNKEWSAYNFLFLKGPSAKEMFLSLKPLTLEKQYNKDVVERLLKYETK